VECCKIVFQSLPVNPFDRATDATNEINRAWLFNLVGDSIKYRLAVSLRISKEHLTDLDYYTKTIVYYD